MKKPASWDAWAVKDDGEEKEGDTKIKVDDGGKQEEKLVIAIDAATGRQYSYDPATGTSLWID